MIHNGSQNGSRNGCSNGRVGKGCTVTDCSGLTHLYDEEASNSWTGPHCPFFSADGDALVTIRSSSSPQLRSPTTIHLLTHLSAVSWSESLPRGLLMESRLMSIPLSGHLPIMQADH